MYLKGIYAGFCWLRIGALEIPVNIGAQEKPGNIRVYS
jgi:hypothetical protein